MHAAVLQALGRAGVAPAYEAFPQICEPSSAPPSAHDLNEPAAEKNRNGKRIAVLRLD
jgi:hypothetical protein